MPATLPKLTVSHDRITLNLGNGRRLNSSRYRDSASGDIPTNVFTQWVKLRDNLPAGCATFGEACQHFADNIATIWPEWNRPLPVFNVGDRVFCDLPRIHSGNGVITSKRGSTCTVRFDTYGIVEVPASLLKAI